MTRVDLNDFYPDKTYVVPRGDYETDRVRGFTVLEYSPAQTVRWTNPRRPDQTIEKQLPVVLMFRCMRCQYDVVDSVYAADPETKQPRTGLDLIKRHMDNGVHPWAYNAFESPYGNVADVKIEGVEDYTKEI